MSLEWWIAVLVLLAVLAALGRFLRSWVAWVGLAACFAGALFAFSWQQEQLRQRAESQTTLLAATPRAGRPGGYASSDTCRSCHPPQYDSWHQSFHRTMTQYATPEAVRGNFNDVTLHHAGDTFHLQRQGGEFWVDMVDPDWSYVRLLERRAHRRGEGPAPAPELNPPRSRKRVGLVTGSHHMQAYWVSSAYGNMQFSLPFTYLFESERWVPRNDVFLLDPARDWIPQIWNNNCLGCHATAGQPRQDPATKIMQTRVGEQGIACEACHGPAQEHVRVNGPPARRYAQRQTDAPDPTIFNPARADHVRSSQTCGQCHAIRRRTQQEQWMREGLAFVPGEDLEAVYPLVHYDGEASPASSQPAYRAVLEGSFWSDGMVRVSGREYNGLAGSACFQRGQLTCLSCHSMHSYASNDDQLSPRMEGNQACLQCHTSLASKLESHTHHRPGSSGSLCYNCHMPHTTYGLLKAIRSHYIDSPTIKATLATGRPNACNACHLDQSLGWAAEKLHQWYGQPRPALSADQQSTSAALLWLLSGDAGQRALAAWHMGWRPAGDVSGQDWLAPYLAELLQDPYSVVRHIAHRSLKRLPGFSNFAYDYIGPAEQRTQARQRAVDLWNATPPRAGKRAALLLDSKGALQTEKIAALLKQRDDRSMELLE